MLIPLRNADHNLALITPLRRWHTTQKVEKREEGGSVGGKPGAIYAVIAIVVLIVLLLIFGWVHYRKLSRDLGPLRIPEYGLFAKIKKMTSWKSSRGEYSTQLQPNTSAPTLVHPTRDRTRNRAESHASEAVLGDAEREMTTRTSQDIATNSASNPSSTNPNASNGNTAGVDRNTSVRSVMTLPAYTPSARPNEQILGREGERAGVDVVLEFPETIDEEEFRREEEMESLYQIRRQRREEQAEREERRRLRREARARGDNATVTRLQAEARQRTEQGLRSQELITSHQAATANRERRVSAVQYQNLGVARHDGSRIRANSTDSDNGPLLDNAASMAGVSGNNYSLSNLSLSTSHRHERTHSSISLVSASSDDSGAPHSRRGSRLDHSDTGDFEVISLQPSQSYSHDHTPGSDSSPGFPADQPPDYDTASWGDAPPYEDVAARNASVRRRPLAPPAQQVRDDDHSGRGSSDDNDEEDAQSRVSMAPPQLPALTAIPSIEVTAFSPVSRGGSVRSVRTAGER